MPFAARHDMVTLHGDPENVARVTSLSIPPYRNRQGLWRQGMDSAGGVDVAVIEIERPVLIAASSFGLRFQGEGYFLTDARPSRSRGSRM